MRPKYAFLKGRTTILNLGSVVHFHVHRPTAVRQRKLLLYECLRYPTGVLSNLCSIQYPYALRSSPTITISTNPSLTGLCVSSFLVLCSRAHQFLATPRLARCLPTGESRPCTSISTCLLRARILHFNRGLVLLGTEKISRGGCGDGLANGAWTHH